MFSLMNSEFYIFGKSLSPPKAHIKKPGLASDGKPGAGFEKVGFRFVFQKNPATWVGFWVLKIVQIWQI